MHVTSCDWLHHTPALPLAPPRPLHGGRRHGALLHQVVLLTAAVPPAAAHAAEPAAYETPLAALTVPVGAGRKSSRA